MLAVLIRTVLIYATVVFSMRLMGKRQIGELQPSELVSTFLVSNLASISIEDPDLPLTASLAPVLLIAALEIFNSVLCYRFEGYSRLLSGKPVTVIRDGVIDQGALRQLRMSTGDLLEAMRGKDLFDPQDVYWGLVETDGSLSLCPSSASGTPLLPLVVDGCIQRDNLHFLKKDESWLSAQLHKNRLQLTDTALLMASPDCVFAIRRQEETS